MPLPLRTLLVLPNPWAAIHPEKGPQGNCLVDPAGRENAPDRFVGAVRSSTVLEERPKYDPRGHRVDIWFTFPALKANLLEGVEPLKVPVTSGYYRARLAEGSLVPGDEKTAEGVPCRFASLEEAKEAGVAEFDAQHGEGSWQELEKLLADEAKATKPDAPKDAPKKTKEPVTITGTGGGKPEGGKG